MTLKERAKNLKIDLPAIFIALKKKETPGIAKLFAAMTVAYALSPIDFIPDFIPVLGYLDDIILLPALIALTLKFIPKKKFEICKQESSNLWENGKPKKWYYSIPMLLIWLIIIGFILKLLFKYALR